MTRYELLRYVEMQIRRAGACLIGVLLWLLAGASVAVGLELPESVQIHGFGSLAYINTSANRFFGSSEDGSWDFYELGLNGSWRATNDLLFSAQITSREAGKTDDGNIRLDYGFVDYSFLSDEDKLWGLRVGRVVNPLGLYNETRDVAFTRPSIFLPQGIYIDIDRNLALSADGVHLYGEQRTKWGDFYFQAGAVVPRTDDPDFQQNFTGGILPGKMDGKGSWVSRILYERNGGELRLALSGGQFNGRYNPSAPPGMDNLDGDFRLQPVILSFQYNAERWSLTSEFERRRLEFGTFGPLLPTSNTSPTGEAYYVQGTYRIAPKWEALVRYDNMVWDLDDRSGKRWQLATGIPAHSRFAQDWTFGLRWDVTPWLMLRAEYHRIHGTGWLSAVENPGIGFIATPRQRADVSRNWNLFAVQGAVRF